MQIYRAYEPVQGGRPALIHKTKETISSVDFRA